MRKAMKLTLAASTLRSEQETDVLEIDELGSLVGRKAVAMG